MTRWAYYFKLAALDFSRLWASTQHHIIIVAGIVLPILLLLGLKRGHVAELREELLRSPTGRQVTFWSGQQGDLLRTDSLRNLQADIKGVEIVIPEIDRIVELSHGERSKTVTLYATRPGDPVLKQAGCEILPGDGRGLVISRLVADELGVVSGDRVDVSVRRRASNREEVATTACNVTNILEQAAEATSIGYADFDLLDKFEQWIRGFRVAELAWSASGAQVGPRYVEYLLFLEGNGAKLSQDDQRTLDDRGFEIVEKIEDTERSLGGCITDSALDGLTVVKLRPLNSTPAEPIWMNISAAEIESFTGADDVVVPWNGIRSVDGGAAGIAGVSLKKRSWLRNHLRYPELAFDFTVDGAVFMPDGGPAPSLRLKDGKVLVLSSYTPEDNRPVERVSAITDERSRIVVVPVQFLARLAVYDRGAAEFDEASQGFVPAPEPSVYGKARLFASTIDDVPGVVESLVSRRFAVISESSRIREIHEQDSSLQLLVLVVGLGVFLFGILTVLSVLIDSTDRKRGVIGILRVMGVSREGIFLLVLLRAAAIGILAGVVAAAAGWAIGQALAWRPPANSGFAAWKPGISIHIHPYDVALVMIGAVACAAIGAIFPAWKAAKLDPFDAIVEGRFT